MYELWLTIVCVTTLGLGMIIAWAWGYNEGVRVGFKRGRRSNHATLAKVVDLHARR